jgi:hypothetical protein
MIVDGVMVASWHPVMSPAGSGSGGLAGISVPRGV